MGPDGKPIDPRTNPEYKGVKELGAGAINIAKWTGIDKMEASHLLKTQPQLITLMQMYQEAVKQGDEEKADSIERRIYDTAWTIKKTGRPVLGPDFKPIDPRTNPDYQNVYEAEELDEGLGKALLGGAALIAAITGINKMEANHLMKTEPQLITLSQMHQEAVKQGDEYRAKEIEDRIEKTLDFIRVKGRPVMGVDGKPVDPREPVGEAEYQGRKVPLGKPMQGDVKKSKVYVKKPNGKVVKVNFGDKNMKIKKSNPARRKSFRARHNCDNPGPRWKARYWSCRAW